MTGIQFYLAAVLCMTVYTTSGSNLKYIEETVRSLGEQLRVQQLGHELLVRSRGNSGIVRTRDMLTGTKPYFGSSYVGKSFAAIHNHANEKRSIGMGEVVVALNGVEFKSRHNDFLLSSPSKTSDTYMATELLEFPEVPPEVLAKTTVQGQIEEMRQYFDAFQAQDTSIRDYRPYFKAVLCYLEGGWTTGSDTLREPFYSRRHKIRASTYSELMRKHDFETYTGAHMPSEDYAYLPRKLLGYRGTGSRLSPVYGQWSYRIACHELKRHLPTANLVPVGDLAKRMSDRQSHSQYMHSRTVRFNVQSRDATEDEEEPPQVLPRKAESSMLDTLMAEIPGKDNYPGSLEDTSLGGHAFSFRAYGAWNTPKLNAAYYHRLYSNKQYGTDDMLHFRRSFSDETIFMAMNSRPEMAESEIEYCSHNTCKTLNQKWSYAIPLEIVYMNPLSKWNPHKILDRGSDLVNEGKKVSANGRNGGMTPSTAYNGVNDGLFFTTPEKFYANWGRPEMFPADTGMGTYGVLDHEGKVQRCVGAGHRILLPQIRDVRGRVRLRYPIAPVHEEGGAIWKEFAALRDMVLEPEKHPYMFK